MIRRWQESSLSQKQFCLDENCSMNNFQYWLKQFRKVNMPSLLVKRGGKKSGKFIKLKSPEKNISSGSIFSEVVFANGNRIKFYNAMDISQLKQLAH